ncbi:MAG TPA: HlyD family efflux transporter periplasmic adaptor subunit, partial [Mobilitalea sp.]|nr:HlyD family efflux transporter periplasmic adaptor subunit [Mobilitalea sp.]
SIASFKDGDRSNKNISFITIYDPATMVFITNGENSSLFKQGQKVSITVDEVAYQTEVISGEEFTKKASPDLNSGAVYLKAEDKENQLQNGDRGEVTFINNELKNVLYLPSAAVQKENGKSIVYVEDDGGIKSVKEIQTGLEAAGKVQVISGLNEGDSVILD